MKHLKNGQSISGQVNMAARTLTAILVLPAVISLALLLVNAAWYQSSVSRMEEVAALNHLKVLQFQHLVISILPHANTNSDKKPAPHQVV